MLWHSTVPSQTPFLLQSHPIRPRIFSPSSTCFFHSCVKRRVKFRIRKAFNIFFIRCLLGGGAGGDLIINNLNIFFLTLSSTRKLHPFSFSISLFFISLHEYLGSIGMVLDGSAASGCGLSVHVKWESSCEEVNLCLSIRLGLGRYVNNIDSPVLHLCTLRMT